MERMKWTAALLVPALILAGGCAVEEVISAEETELVVAEAPPDESLLLDIGIIEFTAGIPRDNDPLKTRVYEDIRNAETRYLPFHLKKTLQGTGHWGAVRVIPDRSAFTDVIISGAIRKSDGEYFEVEISVDDARGRHWYEKRYKAQTGISSYSQNRDRRLVVIGGIHCVLTERREMCEVDQVADSNQQRNGENESNHDGPAPGHDASGIRSGPRCETMCALATRQRPDLFSKR